MGLSISVWCATRGRHEQGEKIIGRLNGGIEGYDVSFHYGIIRRTIEAERAHSQMIDGEERGFLQELRNLKEVFIGSNGVSRINLGSLQALIAISDAYLHCLLAGVHATDDRSGRSESIRAGKKGRI